MKNDPSKAPSRQAGGYTREARLMGDIEPAKWRMPKKAPKDPGAHALPPLKVRRSTARKR